MDAHELIHEHSPGAAFADFACAGLELTASTAEKHRHPPELDRSLSSGLREEAQEADNEVDGVGEDEVNVGAACLRRGHPPRDGSTSFGGTKPLFPSAL